MLMDKYDDDDDDDMIFKIILHLIGHDPVLYIDHHKLHEIKAL